MAKKRKASAGQARKRKNAPGAGRPKTTGIGELVGLRCHKPFLSAVDAWRGSRDLSRPAAILQLAQAGLDAAT